MTDQSELTQPAPERSISPAAMRRRARVMRIANAPMRWLLALPFRTPLSGRLMLVFHVGRRTGRVYRQPVSYTRDGAVLLTPGGGRWTRNLHDGEPVTVRLAGRRVLARPDLVADPDEVDRLLHRMIERNPMVGRFVPFVGEDGTTDRATLERAIDHGFRVVRWQLDTPDGTATRS